MQSIEPNILEKICGYLEKRDLKQCSRVNKHWNGVAQSLLGEKLHISLSGGSRRLYKDLFNYPLFATKVTKITIRSPDVYEWISTLRLCHNVSVLEFTYYCPCGLLVELACVPLKLPNLQYIHTGSQCHPSVYQSVTEKYRETLTKLDVDPCQIDNLPLYLSRFPNLGGLRIVNADLVNLPDLLLTCRKLQYLDVQARHLLYRRPEIPWLRLQHNLRVFKLDCITADADTLRLIDRTLDQLYLVHAYAGKVIKGTQFKLEKGQSKKKDLGQHITIKLGKTTDVKYMKI